MNDAIRQTRWEDVELETVNPSMQRRVVTGERMTVARIWFKDGFRVPLHSHEHEQITQVVSGTMRFHFGADRSQTMEIGPGGMVVIPSNVPHEAFCVGDVEEIDIWSPRRDDWLDGTDDYLRDPVPS
jgi:quercetin dioxygenase-like cupin family protein